MKTRLQPDRPWAWLAGVSLMAVILRILLAVLYHPITFGDTGSYRRLAGSILNGWRQYDGTRTPGYPLFLAFTGDDQAVFLAQMGLGVVITLLIFFTGWRISGRPWFASLLATAHTLNLGQLFFEANLLTETLATFWIIATLAGTSAWLEAPRWRSPQLAALLAVSASMAWLTRPLYIFLPFWIVLYLPLGSPGKERRRQALQIAAFLLPALAILGLWTNFIHTRFKIWGLSTMSGYNLIQHSGHFFEHVPDEYAALRDTYLKYRDAHIAAYGTQTNTIWEAIPEMQKVSGMSFYQLSRVLTGISLQLIREHPGEYLRNVIHGWWMFWRAPVYWSPDALRWTALSPLLAALVLAERAVLVGANLLFIISSVGAAVFRGLRRLWRLAPALWCLAGTVWISSILQTLIDHGDNPRFLVPMQSLVIIWVAWVILHSVKALRFPSSPEAAT